MITEKEIIKRLQLLNEEIRTGLWGLGIFPKTDYEYIDYTNGEYVITDYVNKHYLDTAKMVEFYRSLSDIELLKEANKYEWHKKLQCAHLMVEDADYGIAYLANNKRVITLGYDDNKLYKYKGEEEMEVTLKSMDELGFGDGYRAVLGISYLNVERQAEALNLLVEQAFEDLKPSLVKIEEDLKQRIDNLLESLVDEKIGIRKYIQTDCPFG